MVASPSRPGKPWMARKMRGAAIIMALVRSFCFCSTMDEEDSIIVVVVIVVVGLLEVSSFFSFVVLPAVEVVVVVVAVGLWTTGTASTRNKVIRFLKSSDDTGTKVDDEEDDVDDDVDAKSKSSSNCSATILARASGGTMAVPKSNPPANCTKVNASADCN